MLDLGTLRNADEIAATNTMRFGVQNVFETRDDEYGSREIARFDVYQDVNFDKRRNSAGGRRKIVLRPVRERVGIARRAGLR